jgi:soluble lytic murein transglycosylase-like protein
MIREITQMTGRLPSLLALFFLVMCCSGTNAVAENIYSFIDANGVPNFSNVPDDPRYKKLHIIGQPVVRLKPAPSAKMVRQAIADNSQQHRVDPALVRAVIKAESSFNAGAVSRKGAMGLMQLMPQTALSLHLSNPYDPQQNISGGVRHLRYLLDRFQGNVPLALAAYNAGETRVSRESRIPRIGETREYVRRVLRYYKDYRQQDLHTLASSETRPRIDGLSYVSSN